MKGVKIVAIIIGVLLVLIIGAVVYLASNANRIVQGAIENLGSQYLGTRVTVGQVDLSLQEGRATILDLQVDSPAGYEGPYAMRLDEVSVVLDVANSDAQTLVIKKVLMDGAAVAAVFKDAKNSNFQAILDALPTSDAPAEETADEPGMKLIIDQLDFVNANAKASSPLVTQAVDVDLPDIHLTGIGRKEQGTTVAEATRQIMKPITEAIIREGLKKGIGADRIEGEVRGKLDDAIGGGLDKLKRLSR